MRRVLAVSLSAVVVAATLTGAAVASSHGTASHGTSPPAAAVKSKLPSNATTKIAGLQHFCGSNGFICTEPATTWDELAGYNKAVRAGARVLPYIGHDEPATLFYSDHPGAGNDVTWQMVLPKDPPTRPQQDGSGGTYGFQLHPAFWFGMVMCDPNGSPNVGGIPGHPVVPCTPDSNSNIFASQNAKSPRYFGLGPGQAYEELQFYPPGWVPQPMGVGCSATQWCAALNIDTFQNNSNTGALNSTACLNSAGPEPVNFDFLTKNGVSTAPGSPLHPEHFIPVLSKDFLMNPGDSITTQLFDTPNGLRTTIVDHTTHSTGSMTASASNGFATVNWAPTAKKCTATPWNFHPEFSTSSPLTRNVSAAHTYNIAFSDEIGHFEYCGKVGTDPLSTCLQPLGSDTNNGDTAGLDPLGDDNLCLPASASLAIKIAGCLGDIDGDFDGVPYGFNWPGSISNPVADALLHPTSELFSSPTTGADNFTSMAFEGDQSRNESSDTAFRVVTPCQRHVQNPADPHPGVGCVNPPPNSNFYPFYSTRNTPSGCMWQEGGPYIPGTTNTFGGSAKAEFGTLRAIHYPTAPYGLVTIRLNDFRSATMANPCPAGNG
jgi:hypothetical protein